MTDWLHFDRDVVLRAGAGTGKTHALVSLYLRLVAGVTARRRPLPPTSLVAISFTEKAASDLNAKIRARVERLAAGDPDAEPDMKAAARELDLPLPSLEDWERCLMQLGAAPVGTFHHFAGALLRRHAIAARVDPGYRQLDEPESRERLRAAAEQAVLAALEAGDAEVESLVVDLGYSGTPPVRGLVETLITLHQRRAEEGRGGEGLDDTYAADALANDWRSAGDEVLAAGHGMATLAGLGPRWSDQQRQLARALPTLAASLRAADEPGREPALALTHDVIDPVIAPRASRPGCREAKKRLGDAVRGLEEAVRGQRAAPHARALRRLVIDTRARYDEDKRRQGALDFADLILRARDLLRDDAQVRAAERTRFEALLVDEFQDTNAVQAELVALLAGRAPALEDGAGARLLVVGDRKQSIYEFRGADVGVFVAMEASVRERGVLAALDRSWRSRPALVHFANRLFAHAFAVEAGAPAYRIRWDASTDVLRPARDGDVAPRIELLVTDGDDADDAETRLLSEAAALAHRIAGDADVAAGSIALLLRSFTNVDVYVEALRRAGVPYVVVNGRGFYEAQEVRDLAAALRLLDDPDDVLALVTVLRSPLAFASDETLLRLKLARLLSRRALLDGSAVLALPAAANEDEQWERERLVRLVALLDGLQRRADRLGPVGVLRAIIDGTDLEAILAGSHHGEQRIANLAALVERARAAEAEGGDLRSFVRRLAESTEPGLADREPQAPIASEEPGVVRVMTVHQAKGLEFDTVAVAACGVGVDGDRGLVLYDADGGLGLKVRVGADWLDTAASRRVTAVRADKALAESLRLLYVAATRARERLVLSGGAGRGGDSSWRALLERAATSDPAIAPLLLRVDARAGAARPTPEPVRLPAGDPVAARILVERAFAGPPVAPPGPITVAVTELADFALCPRRHQLLHTIGMAEHPPAARPAGRDFSDGDLDPLARGTLAHRLLELADPAAAGADLEPLLEAGGYDPSAPAVAEVRRRVARFLVTPFARSLGGGSDREVWREVPFLLGEPGSHGAQVRLRGQIDLLVIDRVARTITIVDYKNARAGTAEDYRFQLDAYALAAVRLVSGADRVRAGLAFLAEHDPQPRLAERSVEEVERFGSEVGRLGGALATARAAGRAEGRPVAFCRAVGCGYVGRCHREDGADG